MLEPKGCCGLRHCDACRVWFLLAWKEQLLDIVVKIEKRRKVRLFLACQELVTSTRQGSVPL